MIGDIPKLLQLMEKKTKSNILQVSQIVENVQSITWYWNIAMFEA